MQEIRMTEHVVVEQQGAVLTLRLDRPEKKNALTGAMYSGLADGLDRASADPAIRVVVVTGGAAFTAGNDLGDFLNSPPAGEETPVARFLRTIEAFEKPLIAAVAGVAVGVGTTMLLHCDLVYAGESALLQLPFVNIGLVPEAGSSLLLPRAIGMAKATELLFFGRPVPAIEAERIGLVNAVLPDVALAEHVARQAEALARQPAGALRATKALLRRAKSDTAAERMAEESVEFGRRLRSPEAIEAMSAFMEKRKPDFSRFG
jgi:enoyl-CoA hydratase/carnithine racemase